MKESIAGQLSEPAVTPDRQYEREWHLDKKVPIALIGTLLAQTIAIVWWAANLSTRVDALERQYLANVPRMESVIRLETKVDGLTSGLQELKAMLRGREARP
jgi:hypothetical protein